MRVHTLTVRGADASIDDSRLAQGSVGTDRLMLSLDASWHGLDVSVTFSQYGHDPVTADWVGDPIAFPAKLLKRGGGCVWLTVVGRAEGEVAVTANLAQPLIVRETGVGGGCGCGGDANLSRLAVPVVSEDGMVSWHWGYTSDGLPDPTGMRGPQGPKGDKGEPGAAFVPIVGEPTEQGEPGQLYLDVSTGDVYAWKE